MSLIETERLILREFNASDAKYLVAHINNLNVTRYLSRVPFPYSAQDAEFWINHCHSQHAQGLGTNLVITIKPLNQLAGSVGLIDIDRQKQEAEIGYWLSEIHWKQGYAEEAIKAFLKFVFKELDMKQIKAKVFKENIASAQLLRKLRFQLVESLPQSIQAKSTGKIHDQDYYELKGDAKDYCNNVSAKLGP